MPVAVLTSDPPQAGPGFGALETGALFAFGLATLTVALSAPYPIGFDEAAHLAYALHIALSGDFWPAFDDLTLIGPDLATWTSVRNHLNHPPVYYALMGAVANVLGEEGRYLLVGLRLVNAVIAIGAVGVLLSIPLSARLPTSARALYAALIVSVPTLPVIGGTVSNDNLALLGGALCSLGVVRLTACGRASAAWRPLGIGLVLASCTKLTAALLCWALIACALGLVAHRRGPGILLSTGSAMAFVAGLVALTPYIIYLLQYGSPAPFTAGQVDLVTTRLAEMSGGQETQLGPGRYLLHFLMSFLMFWPPIMPKSALSIAMLVVPLLCLVTAVAGVGGAAVELRADARDGLATLVVCGSAAIAVVLVVHFGFGFARHLETGWLKGIYPRYYFPLVAVLPAACAHLVTRLFATGQGLAVGLAVLASVYALGGWVQLAFALG